jgi:radical SAM protein with 4Fe4S-binding SPASM domain
MTKDPLRIFIEPVNFCNLKCIMCPSVKNRESKTAINTRKAIEILKFLAPYSHTLHLYEWGEPLLHPDIMALISASVELQYQVRLSTNMNTDNFELIEFLGKSDIKKIRVSIDAASPLVYSKIRVNGDFDKVLRNIKLLVKTRDSMNKKRPFIELAFIIMNYNQHEIERFKELAISLKVDRVYYKTMTPFTEEENKYLPDKKYHGYGQGKLSPDIKVDTCIMPFEAVLISSTGDVYPCGFARALNKLKYGNIYSNSIKEIWNSKEAALLRSRIKENISLVDPCNRCDHISSTLKNSA